MSESPQSFAIKSAIVEILKNTDRAAPTREELIAATLRHTETVTAAEVSDAIEALKLEDEILSEVVGGKEVLRFLGA